MAALKKIYTIGHSNRPAALFIEMLRAFDVTVLADVRSMPGSKWQPQYNSAALATMLMENGIRYVHYRELGGRIPKQVADTNASTQQFSGYWQYMQSDAFKQAIDKLQFTAQQEHVAYMCAEANWWQCHRSQISDYLVEKDWEVVHITGLGRSVMHVSTPPEDTPVRGSLF